MAKGQDPDAEDATGFYGMMTRMPWLFAVFMPIVCIVLFIMGLLEYEVNDQLSSIWRESAGKFYDNEQYREDSELVVSGVSSGLFIAKERNGGNLFEENKLQTIINRMADTEASTTVTVDGNIYDFKDLCALADIDEHYSAPCVRITSMDMWKEAGYAWDASFAGDRSLQKWWYKEAVLGNLVGAVNMYAAAAGLFVGPNAATLSCSAPSMPLDTTKYPTAIDGMTAFLTLDGCAQCYQDVTSVLETNSAGLAAQFTGSFQAQGIPFVVTPSHVLDGLLVKTIRYLAIQLQFSSLYSLTELIAGITAQNPAATDCLGNSLAGVTPYKIIDGSSGQYSCLVNTYISALNATYAAGGMPQPAAVTLAMANGGALAGLASLFGLGLDLQPNSACVGNCGPTDSVNFPNVGCEACVVPTTGIPLGQTDPPSNPACIGSNDFGHIDTTEGSPTFGSLTGSPCLAFMDNLKWYQAIAAGYDTTSTAKSDGTARGAYNWAVDFLSNYAARPGPGGPQNEDLQTHMVLGQPTPYFFTDSGDPYRIQIGQNLLPAYVRGRVGFTGKNESEILKYGSGNIYTFDEGVSVGNISKYLTLGGTTPAIGEYDCASYSSQSGVRSKSDQCAAPLTEVEGVQTLYLLMRPKYIMQRVANTTRARGALTITEDTAKKVLKEFKKAFEDKWTRGWDDKGTACTSPTDCPAVQFVAFTDDSGARGSFARALDDVTTGGVVLTAISYGALFVISVSLLWNRDRQHSRVVAGIFGTTFSIIAFLGAIGITALSGTNLQIVQMWTLPFLMVGIGVDDMYIVTLALSKAYDTSAKTFADVMAETAVPVTMTSITNLAMFAIMTMVTIPAAYETAYTAMYAIGLLYLMMLTAYPAVMYLDLKRQEGTCKLSVLTCCGKSEETDAPEDTTVGQGFVYKMLFKPMLGNKIFHAVVLVISAGLIGVSAYAVTDFDIGVGIKEFAEKGTQLKAWAEAAESTFPTWPMSMSWGDLDYTDPKTQLHMVKQFEAVINTRHVDFQKDTDKDLWIGSLQNWGSRVCDNGDSTIYGVCGSDFTIPASVTANTGRSCTSSWIKITGEYTPHADTNKYNDYQGRDDEFMYIGSITNQVGLDTAPGLCVTGRRLAGQMNIDGTCVDGSLTAADYDSKYCPVFAHSTDGLSGGLAPYTDAEFQYCMGKWRLEHSGGSYNYKVYEADGITRSKTCTGVCPGTECLCPGDEPEMPIKVTTSGTLYAIDLTSHETYVKMIEDARKVCDDDDTAPWTNDASVKHGCWVRGIPVDYWSQYLGIETFLITIVGYAVAAGFVVSTLFLMTDLLCGANSESEKSAVSKIVAATAGGLIIAVVCAMSVLTVVGLGTLLKVNLTVFSIMSYMMCVGYAVEYSVHIVHRFMCAPVQCEGSQDRVEFAMDFLFMPCFMAFVSSTVGVVVMAFTDLSFIRTFFFTPLFICMLVTYWYGIFFLPVLLQYVGFQCLQVGPDANNSRRRSMQAWEHSKAPI